LIAARSVSVAACGLVAVQWAPAGAAHLPHLARALGIATRLAGDPGVLLTFDDGPHPLGTPAALSALERLGARAVFFVSGDQAVLCPELVRETVAAGHEVALHGYRHETRRQLSRRVLWDDTRRAMDAVCAASGTVPRLYRPPHGVFTLTGLRLVRSLGLTPLLWSRWGRDWERRATSSSIARRAATGIRAGDVVLLHDADHHGARGSWRRTIAALPEIRDRVEAAGLRWARVAPTSGV